MNERMRANTPKKILNKKKKNVKQKQTILQTKQNVYKMSNVS